MPSGRERRQLTVVFCDIVGSTRMAEQVDPEILAELYESFQTLVTDRVAAHGGSVVNFMGDGIAAVFGYPRAHEDDGRRAVACALEIIEARGVLGYHLAAPSLRIGVHTGLALIGASGEGAVPGHMAVVGEVPNVAARIQGLAAPDTVILGPATADLVRGFFELEPLGAHEIRGLSRDLDLYRPVAATGAASRFEAQASRGGQLIGRTAEVQQLMNLWAQASHGLGATAIALGEAGIGKSRLLYEVRRRLAEAKAETPTRWLQLQCAETAEHRQLAPLTEFFLRHYEREDEPGPWLVERLSEELGGGETSRFEAIALAAVLGLPLGSIEPPTLGRGRLVELAMRAATQWFLARAAEVPLVIAFEDMHWADPSTVQFLERLWQAGRERRILVLATARPEFRPAWIEAGDLVRIRLQRLGPAESRRLILSRVGAESGERALIAPIVNASDGVPLYLEELARSLIELGKIEVRDGRLISISGALEDDIPASIRDLLVARLDRLGPVRPLAGQCAVLGRSFSLRSLQVIANLDPAQLAERIETLVEAQVIVRETGGTGLRYEFRHRLLQQAAYDTLTFAERKRFHFRLVEALSGPLKEDAEQSPELLARHCEAAGLPKRAALVWIEAGGRAVHRSAFVEALGYFDRALKQVAAAQESSQWKAQLELGIRLKQGAALVALYGWATPMVEDNYRGADRLAEHLGDAKQGFDVLRGLINVYILRGDMESAGKVCERLGEIAGRSDDDGLFIEAERSKGVCAFLEGKFVESIDYLDAVIRHCESSDFSSHAYRFGVDPLVVAGCWHALALWFRGQGRRSVARIRRVASQATRLEHPFSLAYATAFAAMVEQCRGKPRRALGYAEVTVDLAEVQGYPYWSAWGSIVKGWALHRGGEEAEGLAVLRGGLAAYAETSARQIRPYGLTLLADCHLRASQSAEGLAAVDEALALAEETGIRFMSAESHRVRAALLRLDGENRAAEAREALRRAWRVAREQQADGGALRAALALVELTGDELPGPERRHLLAREEAIWAENTDAEDLSAAAACFRAIGTDV